MSTERDLYVKQHLERAVHMVESAQDIIDVLVRHEYGDFADDSIKLGEVLESLNGSVDAL